MVYKDVTQCVGCGMCAVVCPVKCLDIKLNEKGFYVPYLNPNIECINCKKCVSICPQFMECKEVEPKKIFSVVSKDDEVLKTSSSGGICYELGKKAIELNREVCGCVYDYKNNIAVHRIINNIEDLEETKGSKYFQSYTVDAYVNLFDGTPKIVFGSPCQIAAIDAYAKKRKIRENLVLVDFFCHGTPSMKLWHKYLKEHNEKEIKKIEFRSKEAGWHNFSLKFNYIDGNEISDSNKNMFYRYFFDNQCLNNSCYSCKFKANKSYADIRVGDFWGNKYRNNTSGVSCCVAFTKLGVDTLNEIADRCIFDLENFEDVMEEQMYNSPKKKKLRKVVFWSLNNKRTLKENYDTIFLPYRIWSKLKSMIRR